MPERTAKVEQEYAGRRVAVGERFEVEPGHVGLLLAIGRIEEEVAQESRAMGAAKPAEYLTRDLHAEPRPKRKYTRRKAA